MAGWWRGMTSSPGGHKCAVKAGMGTRGMTRDGDTDEVKVERR